MKKIRWIAVPVIALALIGAKVGLSQSPSARQAPPPAPEVTVAQVIVRPITPAREFTGRLEAVNTVHVRPRVNGYVESMNFREGDLVHKGQLLFRIDPRPYQAVVDRLSANLRQAKAELALAETNAGRARRLVKQHAISRQEADRLKTAAQSAGAHLAAISAALDAARLNLGFTQVRSPIDGRISNARITPGNLVTSADVLTTVVTVDPVYAYFQVDEQSYLQMLQSGSLPGSGSGSAKGATVFMALADEQGYPHRGRVDFVDNSLRSGTGTIRLRAVFDNRDGSYTPGLFARIKLMTGGSHPTALIDDRAVGTDLSNKFVYVVGKDNKIEYRKVTLGPLFNGLRIVTSGLNRGDVIVVNGLQRVRAGVKVAPTRVAMDRRLNERQRAIVNRDGIPPALEGRTANSGGARRASAHTQS